MNYTIEISIVLLFLVLNLSIGLYYGWGTRTIKNYAVGERKFSSLGIVSTITATYVSGDLFISYVTETYKEGLLFIIAAFSGVICLLIIGWCLVPRMNQFLDSISVAEAMGRLYGQVVRLITAVASLALAIGMIAVQIKVFSSIFSHFFNLSGVYAVLISTMVITTYCAFGGIKSVVFTDIIQFFTFSVFLPTFALFLLQGFSNFEAIKAVVDTSPLFDFQAEFSDLTSFRFLSYFSLFLWCLIPSLNPTMFQRVLLSKDYKQTRKSFLIAALLCFFILLFISFIALVILSYKPDIAPDMVVVYAIDACPFIWLKSFALIGIMAMVMSTADSWLNSASIIFVNDIYKPLNFCMNDDLVILRAISIFIGGGALLLALSESNLLKLALLSANFYMPIVTVPLLFAIFGIYTTSRVVVLGMATGIIVVITWKKYLYPVTFIDSVIPAMIANSFVIALFYLFGERNTLSNGYNFKQDNESKLLCIVTEQKSILIEKFKQFSFEGYLKANTPQKSRAFAYFGVFSLLNILPTFFFDAKFYEYRLFLVNTIQALIITISAIFIFHELWLSNFKRLYIAIIWRFAVFISLGVISLLVFLLSSFTELSLIIFGLSFIIMSTLLNWQETILMTVISALTVFFLFYMFEEKEEIARLLATKALAALFLSGVVVLVFVKLLQDRYSEEKKLRADFEKQYLDLEKSYLELGEQNQSNLQLSVLLDQRIDSEKAFTNLMNHALKCHQIKALLNKFEHRIDYLPIMIYEKTNELINLDYHLDILQKFMNFYISKSSLKITISSNIKQINLNVSCASFIQILFSLSNNVLEFIPDNENIEITITSDGIEFTLVISYSGFGLNEDDLLRFTKNKRYINPFLLTWKKLFDLLDLAGFGYDFSSLDTGGTIKITKFLSEGIYKFPKMRKNMLNMITT